MLAVSCREEEKLDTSREIDGLGGEVLPKTELDYWLYDNFTVPYNIEVVYRWNSSEIQPSWQRPLVPVKREKVKTFMEIINKVWFGPYRTAAGEKFLKQTTPKQIVLGGSAEWEFGAIKLGQAEGGNKILLLNVNGFDPSQADGRGGVKEFLHTIEHEFGHILHQTILFDKTFQSISAGKYDPTNWNNIADTTANKKGFITAYAMSGKDEDFVEMLSMIMVYGRDNFEAIVSKQAEAGNDEAVQALRKKEAMVVSYLKNSWKIDFYDTYQGKGIVTLVQEVIQEVVKEYGGQTF